VEVLAICSSGLLGLETITAIWSRKEAQSIETNENIYRPQKRRDKKEKDETERECD
jgi:hypothetical protein